MSRVFSLAAALSFLALAPIGRPLAVEPAKAGDVGPLRAEYVVEWSGIEVGRVEAELRRRGTEYHLAYQARTSGPLRWVADFTSTGWAAGRLDAAGVKPRHFQGQSRWRDGDSFWRVDFASDGRVTGVELDSATLADREPVPDALRQGPDPLSLMLQGLLEVAAGGTLEGESFDGRRAMRVALGCAAEPAAIQPAALGAAVRAALVCEATGDLLAGRSKRWSERGDAQERERPPVLLWLVPDVGGLPHWPVLIEAQSRWGTVAVELASLDEPAS